MKSDALNALIMILIKGPKCGIAEALYLIKQASISFEEHKKRYKKAPAVQEKETSTQTWVLGTQTEILHAEPRSEIDTDEDATTTSGKYIVSNLMEMSDISGADSDDDLISCMK